MIVGINDDFDLKKIMISGQCFRVREHGGKFRFITEDNILDIEPRGENLFELSSSEEEWESFWKNYFDLERNYSEIRKFASSIDPVVKDACEFARGIRILKQEPWEMIITFIISQRKSMPAIARSVESLCVSYGHDIGGGEKSFPSPDELKDVSVEDFKAHSLGYRAPYIYDTVQRANTGELDIDFLKSLNDEELHKNLLSLYGVGEKVANCVELFGFGRTNRAPIDVWIKRIIDEDFGGENPFLKFPENAGIIQQYLFYYAKYRE